MVFKIKRPDDKALVDCNGEPLDLRPYLIMEDNDFSAKSCLVSTMGAHEDKKKSGDKR